MSKEVEDAYKYSQQNLKNLEDSDYLENTDKYGDEKEYAKAKEKFKGKALADEVERATKQYNADRYNEQLKANADRHNEYR